MVIFYVELAKSSFILHVRSHGQRPFFDLKTGGEQAQTKALWIYDLRINQHFTLKQNPLARADLAEFVHCYNPANRHERTATWSADSPEGRWRCYPYDELVARDKVNLDIFWLRDESLEDTNNLPAPDVIAAEIVEDLRTALEQFEEILADLGEEPGITASFQTNTDGLRAVCVAQVISLVKNK